MGVGKSLSPYWIPFYFRISETAELIFRPETITGARLFNVAANNPADDVLLAEFNNYCLGGVYISLVI